MKRAFALTLYLTLAVTSIAGIAPGTSLASDWTTKVDPAVLSAATAGQTDFLVYMNAHADLSAASSLESKADRGFFVYDALTTAARNSQAGVVAQLRLANASYRQFWIANAVQTRGGLSLLGAIASRTDVKAIYSVGTGKLEPPVNVPGGTESVSLTSTVGPSLSWVKADQVWALGYRGQGAVVANADTGVRWTHTALKGKYRGWNAATGIASHDYNWHDAIKNPNAACVTVGGSPEPCDDDILPAIGGGGHGTHTMGTMVGDDGAGNQIGMAPDAKWIACRNMNNGLGAVPTYMDCMQWFIAPTRIDGTGADPSKAPDVVSNSWGCVEVCAPPLLKDMIDASRAAGIFYSVSAGNDGMSSAAGCSTIIWPLAVYDSSFTVGASNATNDGIASFSSRGPVVDNAADGIAYRKPDIVAPGVGIRSSLRGSDTAYGSLSGTSMSSPHVAGLVALMISANPRLRGHVDTLEDIIRKTAKPLPSTQGCGGDGATAVPNNTSGYGRIDALAAVQMALVTDPTPAYTRNTVAVPAQIVDVTKETSTQTHPVTDYTNGTVNGTTTWRVVKDTGNCCEDHLAGSRDGRLFDIGGSFINYTDDRGLTWHSVRPLAPLVNGEGSMAMAPNGDVIAVTWDAYSGDHLVAYKYNADTRQWSTLDNVLHHPFYDRPWLSVIPGPFKDATGKVVPYVSIVQGGTGVKDPMFISTDGLIYAEPSSLTLASGSVNGWFPVSADASFDWIQPIRSSPVTGLGAGYALANGGYQLDPQTRAWHTWRLPGGAVPPTYIQVDSGGRIHNLRSAGAGSLEYRISADGGQTWTSAIVPLPFGGLTDFKVNRAVGISALALRLNNQDWIYKFDISGDTATLTRRYRVGLGDNPAGSSIAALTNPRMDFQTVVIFPDGRVATSFLDSTTFSHPPGTGMLGRITPAVAIELDTTLEAPPSATPTGSPTPTETPSPTPSPTPSATPTATPTPTPTPIAGDAATGGGWVATVEGAKLNFGAHVERTSDGLSGDFQLNDKPAGVKIAISTITGLGAVESGCGDIVDGPTALQITGSGTFNGQAATFRACVQDNGRPNGPTADQLYLECTSGCAYQTSTRTDGRVAGGNIDVQRTTASSGQTATVSSVEGESAWDPSQASAIILDPLLLTELGAGSTQTFSVRVYDGYQRLLANASVTLTTVSSGGTQTLTAVTGPDGTALILLSGLAGGAEYMATSGLATSNAIHVTSVLMN